MEYHCQKVIEFMAFKVVDAELITQQSIYFEIHA